MFKQWGAVSDQHFGGNQTSGSHQRHPSRTALLIRKTTIATTTIDGSCKETNQLCGVCWGLQWGGAHAPGDLDKAEAEFATDSRADETNLVGSGLITCAHPEAPATEESRAGQTMRSSQTAVGKATNHIIEPVDRTVKSARQHLRLEG